MTETASCEAKCRFQRLLEPHLGPLLRFARRRTPSLSDAEDAVQEACLRAWISFASLRDEAKIHGAAEVARRYPVRVALLFMGAARVPEVGPHHLTLTAAEGVAVARVFASATIVPLHFEGWAHFSESRRDITAAFAQAHLTHRLQLLAPGGVADF